MGKLAARRVVGWCCCSRLPSNTVPDKGRSLEHGAGRVKDPPMLPLVEELREVRDKAGTQRAKQQEIPTLAKKSIEIMGPKYGHNYVVFLIRVMKFRANQNRSEAPSPFLSVFGMSAAHVFFSHFLTGSGSINAFFWLVSKSITRS